MSQLTIRTSEGLAERVRAAAAERSMSLNAYVRAVLDAATDPDLCSEAAERVRAKLRMAGLVDDEQPDSIPRRPPADELEGARHRASGGGGLSEMLVDQR